MSGSLSIQNSVMTAMTAADAQMEKASAGIASGDLDGYVDASVAMTMAKMNVQIAATLSKLQDELSASTLSLLA